MGNCTSCGGTKYVPGGKSATPPLVYDVVVDGQAVAVVTDADGGLQEAVRQVGEHRAAGRQAQAVVQRA
jgi:hypothetical protein